MRSQKQGVKQSSRDLRALGGRRPIRGRREGGRECPEMEHGCVSFSWTTAGHSTFRLLPNQPAGAAELAAMRPGGGRGIGFNARSPGTRGSWGAFRWRRTRTDLARRGTRRFLRREGRRPIAGVIHNSPHPLEPPIGAIRAAPASACRFQPGLVLETQI